MAATPYTMTPVEYRVSLSQNVLSVKAKSGSDFTDPQLSNEAVFIFENLRSSHRPIVLVIPAQAGIHRTG